MVHQQFPTACLFHKNIHHGDLQNMLLTIVTDNNLLEQMMHFTGGGLINPHVHCAGVDTTVFKGGRPSMADRINAHHALAAWMHAHCVIVLRPERHHCIQIGARERIVEGFFGRLRSGKSRMIVCSVNQWNLP